MVRFNFRINRVTIEKANTIFDREQRSKSGLKNYLVVVVVVLVVVQYFLN